MDAVLVRAAALYWPLGLLGVAWLVGRPAARERTAALLACLWNVPALLAVHALATSVGWWHYDADGGTLNGFPVDLYLGWVILWGGLPVIALARWPLAAVVAGAALVDIVAMPLAQPVVQLGPDWLVGEALAILVGLVPAQLLARWTIRDEHLAPRVGLQVVCFAGLVVGVLPAIALAASGGAVSVLSWPRWQLSLAVQVLALPAIVGLSAVHEFVQRGHGTPVPFDPPRGLVISGPYAYLANPMQASVCGVLLGLAALLGAPLLVGAALIDIVYGAGLAGWHERAQMRGRFGADFFAYRAAVRDWWPRWRPYVAADQVLEPAVLYVAQTCAPCSTLGRWLLAHEPRGLRLALAEEFATCPLQRLTYVAADQVHAEQGVAALGRALEHINLAWACVGFTVRLPGLCQVVQLLIDAAGGEPREVGPPRARERSLR